MVGRALPLLYGVLNRRSGPVSLRALSALHWLHWWCIHLSPAFSELGSFLSESVFGSPFRSRFRPDRPYWDR